MKGRKKGEKESPKKASLLSSRRSFLKAAPAGIILASGLVGAGETATAKQTYASIPKAMKFLVFDPALCTGCGTCMMACSTIWNDGKSAPALSRISLNRNPFGTSDDNYSPNPCLQCVDAPCMKACPRGAIRIDRTSGTRARIVDEKLCIGIQACIKACPYEEKRIAFDPEKKKALKCHLCNGDPQCVKWCPNGALKFVGPPAFSPVMEYLPEVTRKPMAEKSYLIISEEDRKKELGYPREEK